MINILFHFNIFSCLLTSIGMGSKLNSEIHRINVRATEHIPNNGGKLQLGTVSDNFVAPFPSELFLGRNRRDVNHLDCIDTVNVKITLPPEKFAENHAIVVDHIFDAKSGQKAYLLNPYLIIVKQFAPRIRYSLRQVSC